MARTKRWTIPFASVSDISCVIDIYDEMTNDDTWSSVTELSVNNSDAPGYPAADPFYFEEDDDENLLSPIRVKTGYITLIERTYGSLADMFPKTDMEHYVEVIYGGTLVFTGYIQAQSFDNDLAAPPREIKLPVVSPLGLLEGLKFTKPATPSVKTVGSWLKEVVNGLFADISYVIYPDFTALTGGVMIIEKLHSLVLCPYNEQYSYNTETTELFNTSTYKKFIEALCSASGLIVHDVPHKLVFVKYDHMGDYKQYPVSSLATGANSTTAGSGSGNSSMSMASSMSDEGVESLVMPLSKITLEFDGDINPDKPFNLNHTKTYSYRSVRTVGAAFLDPKGTEFESGHLMRDSNINSSNLLSTNGVELGAFGPIQGTMNRGIYIAQSSSWSDMSLFTWRIFRTPHSRCRLVFKMMWGKSLDDFQSSGYQIWQTSSVPYSYIDADITLYARIKNGSYYYNYGYSSYVWQSTQGQAIPIRISGQTGDALVGISAPPDWNSPLEITISCDSDLSTEYQYMITDMKVIYGENWYDEFTVQAVGDSKEISQNNGAWNSDSINMLFTSFINNENVLFSSLDTVNGIQPTDYSYMFQSQGRLQVDLNRRPGENYWTRYTNILSNIKKWRLIAWSFYPKQDKARWTLHNSSFLDS